MTAVCTRPKVDQRLTLGPLVAEWIEANLCHGPGDVQGQPIRLDNEQFAFLCRAYEIDERGRRVVRRAAYSRPKGRAKSELAAMIVCAEGLGPVRFGGWDEDGYPIGRLVTSPIILCVATEEGQADNTYGAVHYMLSEGAIAETPGLDVGLTRTFLPGGGYIRAISAKASSKDGGKETFVNFDEALALDTPLPTPTGWTTMGEVHAGDFLLGRSGKPVRVLGCSPVHEGRPCYRVTFSDGDSIVADADHL